MSYYVAMPDGSYVEMPDDIPQDQAMRQISLDPRFRPIIEKSISEQSRLLPDLAGSGVRGLGAIPTAIGTLTGLIPGMQDNVVSRGLVSAGEYLSQRGNAMMSPGGRMQQELFQAVMDEADKQGLVEQAKVALREAISNPRMLANITAESIPSLVGSFGGGFAVRGAASVGSRLAGRPLGAEGLRRAGVAGAIGTESLLEGGGSAADVYKEIKGLKEEELQKSPEYQELLRGGLKPEDARESLARSAARQAAAQTAAISGTIGAALPGVETMPFARVSTATRARRALTGAGTEAVQEGGQEGGSALSENIARQRAEIDRELTAGVGSRATLGALVGGITGGAFGGLRSQAPDVDRTEDAELRQALQAGQPEFQRAAAGEFVSSVLPVSQEEFANASPEVQQRLVSIAQERDSGAKLVYSTLGVTQQEFLKAAPEQQQALVAQAREVQQARAAQVEGQPPITAQAGSRADAYRFEEGREAPSTAPDALQGETQADYFRRIAEERAWGAREAKRPKAPPVADMFRAARQTNVIEPGSYTEETIKAAQKTRATAEAPKAFSPIVEGYIRQKGLESPRTPISIPALQQYLAKTFPGKAIPINQLKEQLDRYVLNPQPGAGFILKKTESGSYVPVDANPITKDTGEVKRAPASKKESEKVASGERAPPSKKLGESLAAGETTSPLGEPGVAPEGPGFALPPDVKETLQDLRRGVKPKQQSLVQFLRKVGGLNNTGYMAGEVSNILGSNKALPGLINNQPRTPIKNQNGKTVGYKGGLTLDRAREKLVEEGFLPEDADINDMLNAIREELSGGGVNFGLTEDYEGQERQRAAQQLERALDEAGVTARDSDEDIARALGFEVPSAPATESDIEALDQARFANAPAKPLGPAEEYSARNQPGQATQPEQATKPSPDFDFMAVINDRLNKIKAKGKQGEAIATAIERDMKSGKYQPEQIYAAFKAGEVMAAILPAGANHEIRFVERILKNDIEAQGRRLAPIDTASAGIIEISLSDSVLGMAQETAAHEAFHVLQDYYGQYDPAFKKLMGQSFKDNMTLDQVDSTIKRKLQTIRMPGSKDSYWDFLKSTLPGNIESAREAEAYVFGSLHDAAKRGVPMTGLKPSFTRFVNMLTKFTRRMGNSLRGDGFNSPDDVFGRVVEGDAGRFAGEAAPEFRGSESSARLSSGNQFFDLNTTGRKVKEFGKTTFEYRALNDGSILLDFLATDPEFLNKGEARNGMQQFVSEADALDKIIRVVPEPQNNETNFNRLVDFYRSLGFKKERGSLRMSRAPMGGEEFSARLPPTIEVDGVQRPTTNSEGRPIHPTEEGVRNFWRWFGDSKVVDENGKPLVVYHGTSKDVDFQSFKMKPRGIWFADNPKEASNYAIENDSMGSSYDYAGRISPKNVASRVIPSYLSIQNAIEPTQQEMDRLLGKTGEANYAKVQGEVFNGMKSRGADGVNMGGGVWVAINSPSQIKSAIGNVGEFSGKNPKIQYSARLPPGSATYQAAAKKINGERMKQNSVLKRGIDALVGSRAEYTYVYSGKKEAVKPKTNLAINVANQFHGFHLLDQLMERKGQMDLAGVGRALESAMNNDGRMQTMIEGGGIGLNPVTKMVERNKNVKALADIVFGKIKADEADASQRYFVARRERDERARGRVGFANLTDSEINEIIKYSETNRPEWKEVAKDLNDWNKGLVKILVDSGVLDKKTGDELSSVFYTPFYRLLEDDFQSSADSVIGPKASASLKNPSDALKKLSGEGTDPVGDLFENIIRNADGIVKAALKNVAMQKAVASMEFAGIAEKVKTKLPGAKNIVTIRDNGKDVFYRVDDPLLMTALATMPQSMQHGIFKAMAKVGGFTRDMITHTPAFTIASLIRGKEMSYGQDGVSLARSTVLAFGRALKANFSEAEKKKGDLPINKIRDITGFGGMSFGMGSPDVSAEFKRMLRRASKQETTFDSTKRLLGWYALKRVGESAEMAERIKVYEHFKAKGASDQDAAWEAYAMAPFSRRGAGNGFLGTVVTTLAPIVPFLNARIQGNFRLLEKGIHNPFGMRLIDRKLGPDKVARGMWLRGMVLMGFSMAMAMLASDDEQWDNENPETKFMYHIAYLGSGPDAPRILIPRGFELGTLFGAIPVFMYDAIRKDGGNDLGKLFGLTLQSTFGINPPAALAPVLEVVTNYDFFRGRELESAGMESRPKSERFNAETSEAAKFVADAVNSSLGNLPRGMRVEMSPIQAQHLIKGYLGGVGVWSMQVVDTVLGASGVAPQKPDGFFGDPVSPGALAATALQVNRFVRGKEDMVSRSVGEFYDIKREVTQWTTAMNDARLAGDMARANEIASERSDLFSLKKQVDKASRDVGEISRRMRAIQNNPNMDPQEKADALVPLRQRRNEITGRIMEQAMDRGVR